MTVNLHVPFAVNFPTLGWMSTEAHHWLGEFVLTQASVVRNGYEI